MGKIVGRGLVSFRSGGIRSETKEKTQVFEKGIQAQDSQERDSDRITQSNTEIGKS